MIIWEIETVIYLGWFWMINCTTDWFSTLQYLNNVSFKYLVVY